MRINFKEEMNVKIKVCGGNEYDYSRVIELSEHYVKTIFGEEDLALFVKHIQDGKVYNEVIDVKYHINEIEVS